MGVEIVGQNDCGLGLARAVVGETPPSAAITDESDPKLVQIAF
jgi:hypothetical protein